MAGRLEDGTSWGFRDAWSAASSGRTSVVWIGNFDGEGNPAFVGVDAAAPLFFRIADALNLRGRDGRAAVDPPAGASSRGVRGSGDLPNADCPHTVDTWYIPGKSPIRVSQLHRAVAIDRAPAARVSAVSGGTRFEVFEFWSSDMLALFRERACRDDAAGVAGVRGRSCEPPRIASPLRNVTYALAGRRPGRDRARRERRRRRRSASSGSTAARSSACVASATARSMAAGSRRHPSHSRDRRSRRVAERGVSGNAPNADAV
jgi:penicillin-binding protein 1C